MITLETFGASSRERVERAIQKLQEGKGILLVDDENRENEGDLIFPAKTMTAKDMALMIRECSGIVCLCLTDEKCQALGLRPMVESNTSKNQTAFTISIEAKQPWWCVIVKWRRVDDLNFDIFKFHHSYLW